MQLLFFPDPRPLVERLGESFFRELPEHAGVYLMRDAADAVVYVGKARNLRKRLGSYRVANPDRLARRHLRLLRAVARIELESCADEAAALRRESELLRALRPRFNRAGTWPPSPRRLLWRRHGDHFGFKVVEEADSEWRQIGRIGGPARYLKPLLLRLIWRAVHGGAGMAMPAGWARGLTSPVTWIHCGRFANEAATLLERVGAGEAAGFCDWILRLADAAHPFDRAALAEDLEAVNRMLPH